MFKFLKSLKDRITLVNMKTILKNAEKMHLEKDCIETYFEDYFIEKASKKLGSEVLLLVI